MLPLNNRTISSGLTRTRVALTNAIPGGEVPRVLQVSVNSREVLFDLLDHPISEAKSLSHPF